MSVKAKVEAIIYATEEPVTLSQLVSLLKNDVLAELRAEEEARVALNQVIYEGPHPAEDEDDDEVAWPEAETETDSPATGADANNIANAPGEPLPSDNAEVRSETSTQEQAAGVDSEQSAAVAKQEGDAAKEELKRVKARLAEIVGALIAEYSSDDRGIEIREIAGGYRMATKPEHHDVVIGFAKSLRPPVRLSLQALETLAVIAYKQPATVPEISDVRGVDSAGVIATLLERKLITTAGRKQVIGRPILYKTTKEFLLRFGLKDLAELPSVEEFEKLGDPQSELFLSNTLTAGASVEASTSESTESLASADTDSQRAPNQPLSSPEMKAESKIESMHDEQHIAEDNTPRDV